MYMIIAFPAWERQLNNCDTTDFSDHEMNLLLGARDLFHHLHIKVDRLTTPQPSIIHTIISAALVGATIAIITVRTWFI